MLRLVFPSLLLALALLGSSCNKTPQQELIEAADKGNTVRVGTLLMKGVDPNIHQDKSKITPLIMAARDGNMEMLKNLLENGADIEGVDKRGRTPLMWAAWKNNYEVAEYLLEQEAPINTQSRFKATATFFARKHGNNEILELLEKNGGSDQPSLDDQR